MHTPVRNVHGLRCSCASRTVSQQVLLPAAEKTTTGFIHGCNGPTLAFLQPLYLPGCSCIQSCALGGFVLSLCAPNGIVVCCLGQLTAVSLHSKNTQMIVHFRNIRCMQAAHACPVLIHAAALDGMLGCRQADTLGYQKVVRCACCQSTQLKTCGPAFSLAVCPGILLASSDQQVVAGAGDGGITRCWRLPGFGPAPGRWMFPAMHNKPWLSRV